MTPRSDPVLGTALAILLATLTLDWILLARVGGFAINLNYFGAILAAGLIGLRDTGPRATFVMLRLAGVVGAFYVLYLAILFLGLVGSDGQGIVFRQVFFVIIGLATSAVVLALHGSAGLLRWAALAGIVAFVLTTEVLARRIGQSWLTAVPKFVMSGDLNSMIYGFLRDTFNVLSDNPDDPVQASAKNAVAVALWTLAVLYRAATPKPVDWAGRIVLVGVIGLLLAMSTRSAIIVALVALPVSYGIAVARSGVRDLTFLLIAGGIALIIAVGGYLIVIDDSAVAGILGERLSLNDSSSAARIDQYRWAITRIEGAWLLGSGYAEIDGHPVHNLFLGAWMHAGIFAFLLVSAAYLTGLGLWLRFVLIVTRHPEHWRLPMRVEWVALLPLIGLFRVWLSGDAGHPIFVEWIGYGLFGGLVAANFYAVQRTGA